MRRRRDEWDDAFELLDLEFEEMRAHMDRVLERMFSGQMGQADDPLVYGLSMSLRPGGQPVVRELARAEPAHAGPPPQEREPLTDILESGDEVRVIMELPGADRERIKVQACDRSLELEVADEHGRLARTVQLPCEVAAGTAKASYKNGVLQVVMRKRAPRRKGKAVKVE